MSHMTPKEIRKYWEMQGEERAIQRIEPTEIFDSELRAAWQLAQDSYSDYQYDMNEVYELLLRLTEDEDGD